MTITKYPVPVYRQEATIDGTTTSTVMLLPEGVFDITVATIGASTATGSVEISYSTPEQCLSGTGVAWVAFPVTFTIADGTVALALRDSTGYPLTPTAIKFTRTGGTIRCIVQGKKVVV